MAGLLVLAVRIPFQAQPLPDGETFLGANVCGSCHPAEYRRQSLSGHARTLHRAPEHPLADSFVPAQSLTRPPEYRFRYRKEAGQITVQADDNEYVMELPIEWAFGAGDHGVTFVSRMNRRTYLEHAFSYYSTSDSLELTTGHESIRPETLLQATGLSYTVQGPGNSISDCFECHSTGPLSYSPQQEVLVNEPGVRCESCHGPGGAHVAAVGAGDAAFARSQIGNPLRLPADDLLRFCGACHRDPRGDSGHFDLGLAWNVRHQPPYLRQSRCFQASGEDLTCFTCHDPHDPLRRGDPAYYRDRCVACHDGAQRSAPAEACGAGMPTDCTVCHMPKVAVSPNLKFKNHWIGVYPADGGLKPAR